ncbi:MAG: AmmeMemoRadiSam system protein B [Kiritimatiellae bacterium]|nr:AmmeMemoRadiSam system protein B [Kiritimatiellia bacterium]
MTKARSLLPILIALLWMAAGCAAEDSDMNKNQPICMESTLAGQWYAADGARLRRELDGYLRAAPAPVHPAMAAILPHAGFVYSGPTAAAAARALAAWTGLRRVVLLGFTHHVGLPDRISLPSRETAYRSPLGTVPLDRAALDALAASPLFVDVPATRDGENSIELIVPLLQAALADRPWTLVPLTLGQLDAPHLDDAARAIAPLLDGHTAVVASSDFTHYGDRFGYTPFRDDIPARLSALDHGAIAPILAHDAAAFDAYCRDTSATICGQDPIGLLLRLLPPTATGRELAYDSSGARTGDYDSCVSYAALAFDAPEDNASSSGGTGDSGTTGAPGSFSPLAPDDKHTLLTLARTVIDEALHGDALAELDDMSLPLTPALRERRGAFVTLTIDGELRGCIGEILPRRPLVRVVADHALSAAFEDPRFPPLTAAEWPSVRIEISALTPPRPVDSWHDIQIGRHGMTLSLHGRMAVFLPQVAPEQGWDLETTLTHLSRKAGLPADAWRDPACRFSVFEADVFHE